MRRNILERQALDVLKTHFVYKPVPACRVRRNASVAILNNTYTEINFNQEYFDTDNMWVGGTPNRITIRTAGIYIVGGLVQWAAHAVGYRTITILRNGANWIAYARTEPLQGAGEVTIHEVGTSYQFAINDWITLGVRQTSGGNLTVTAAPEYSATLWAIKVA